MGRKRGCQALQVGNEVTTKEQEQAVLLGSRLRNDLFERLANEHGIKRPPGTYQQAVHDEFDEAESTVAIALARLIEKHLVREALLKARSVTA